MAQQLFNLASVMDDPHLIALTREPKLLIAGVAPDATDFRVTATGGTERTLAAMAAAHDLLIAATPTAGIGTVGAATVTAAEYGDARNHTTVLTLASFAVGTSGDNASLGIGALLYTFPAGIIVVEQSGFIGMGITAAVSNTAQTPEVGLGTVIASGAVAVLNGTATFENIHLGGTPAVAANVAGTSPFSALMIPAAGTPFLIAAASVHTVYFNLAVAWADVTAAGAVTATGTVTLKWQKLT